MTRAATVQICDGPACGYDLGLIAPNIPDDCVGYRSKFLHSAPASLGAHLRRDRVLRGPAVPPRFLFRVTAHSVLANLFSRKIEIGTGAFACAQKGFAG